MIQRPVVVFDIDGTLSDCTWRIPLAKERKWDDFHALCNIDLPNYHIVNLLKFYIKNGYCVILMTGRPAAKLDATAKWLKWHDIPYDLMYIRPDDCKVRDCELKLSWLKMVEDDLGFNKPEVIFDDRPSVIEAMRKAGYNVLDVGGGW